MIQSRKKRHTQTRKQQKDERRSSPAHGRDLPSSKPSFRVKTRVVIGFLVVVILVLLAASGKRHRGPNSILTPVAKTPASWRTLAQLVEMSESELGAVDLALVNLLCSEGLPGRGPTEIDVLLQRLDRIVGAVRQETARNYHRFADKPAEFEHSVELFKILILNSVIGEDFGLAYNPDKIAVASAENLADQSFFKNADDIFLSGLLGDRKMGTCASMPVLLTAVGRRLGYPMKLVAAKGHLFCRWDDGKIRRNIECTNGVNCYPDEHYKGWPFLITDAEVEAGHYLKSLSPREELAVFFSLRGQVLGFHGRIGDAVAAHSTANRLHPSHPDYQAGLLTASRAIEPLNQGDPSLPFSTDYRFRNDDPFAEVREVMELNAKTDRQGFTSPNQAERFLPTGLNNRFSPIGPDPGAIYTSPMNGFPR